MKALRKRAKNKKIDDHEWVRKHFSELVDKYAGKYAVVAEGELFVGRDAALLHKEARRKHPGVIPTGLPIPRPEDFNCAL
jgi:hypothetical protein